MIVIGLENQLGRRENNRWAEATENMAEWPRRCKKKKKKEQRTNMHGERAEDSWHEQKRRFFRNNGI